MCCNISASVFQICDKKKHTQAGTPGTTSLKPVKINTACMCCTLLKHSRCLPAPAQIRAQEIMS